MDRNMFPSWMRDSIKIHSEPNTILPCIERFFTERGFLGRSSKNVKNNFETSIICKKQNYSSPKDNISSRKRNERHFMLNENILEIYDQFQVEKENDENSVVNSQKTLNNGLLNSSSFSTELALNRTKRRKTGQTKLLNFSADYFSERNES
uniref:Uncharacterized protein n=1 Tax=Meloidogyne enterolobii TaxID=390850 RepID=A0A6V7TIA6_MELEN|nr:unnamed protein product [Meloidogyne enterolobii]